LGTNVRGGTLDFDKASIWIELGYASACDYLQRVPRSEVLQRSVSTEITTIADER
jgi:hypothetical protein